MDDQDHSFGQAEARLWVKWVFANFVASMFIAVLNVQVPRLADGELGAILGFLVFWPFGILILATMQWLVLRRWIPRARGWLIATTAGVFLYLSLFGLATPVVTAFSDALAQTSNAAWAGLAEFWSGVAGPALLGVSIGIAQWMVLQRRFSRAGWWILAATAGWAVAGVSQQAFDCLAILSGSAPAALTGVVLVWLARPTLGEEAEPVPRPAPEERTKVQACPRCREQVSGRAVLCRHCKAWLVDRPQAAEAGEKQPAQEPVHAVSHVRLWGMVTALALGTLAALALPIAALVARAAACGPMHSSVVMFAVLALAYCAPAAALPAALAWIMGRRRPDSRTADDGDFSLLRALAGALLGVIIGFTVSAVCACMTFSPECL
jgi:hypothetical protein